MRNRKRGAGGFTLVELIVVIAILAILAGVGTVAYSGYVKRATKAVDQQLVADIGYAMELAAVAGDFNSVEPPAKLGGADLGLIPIGYVTLGNSAECQVFGVSEAAKGAIAQALWAAFGDYSGLRLQYDWSDSTASKTDTANLTSATFIGDVPALWEKVQEMSKTVVDVAANNSMLCLLLSNMTSTSSPYPSDSSGYEVVSQCALPLYYLNQSQEGSDIYAQMWTEPDFTATSSGEGEKVLSIIAANSGEEASVGDAIIMNAATLYARNTCMLNYVRSQVGVCSNTGCLNYQDHNGVRVSVSNLGTFGALTATALKPACNQPCPVDSSMFCDNCLKYAKLYLSDYAENDGLGFAEVMKVVKETNDSYTGDEKLDFGYYDDYIKAVGEVYGAMKTAMNEDGCAVVAVFYSDGQVRLDPTPVELGEFYSGQTASSASQAEATNIVDVIAVKGGDGQYTYTVQNIMTLDLSGTCVGYIRLYEQVDGELVEKTFTELGMDTVAFSGQASVNSGVLTSKPLEIKAAPNSQIGNVILRIGLSEGGSSVDKILVTVKVINSAS